MKKHLVSIELALVAFSAACSTAQSGGEPPAPPPSASSDATSASSPEPLPAPERPRCARGDGPAVESASPTDAGSTIAVGRLEGKRIALVADADERALEVVDLDARAELASHPLGASPSAVMVTRDGRIAVALASSDEVAIVEPRADGTFAERCRVAVPAEPSGLASTADGRVLVTSRWAHALSILEADTFSLARRVDLPRDPVGVVVGSDGKRAFVSHASGSQISVVDLAVTGESAPRARSIPIEASSIRSTAVEMVAPMAALPGLARGAKRPPVTPPVRARVERHAAQGYALVRTSGGRILAPHALSEPKPPANAPAGGYGSAGAPAVIGDVSVVREDREDVEHMPGDDSMQTSDCILPRGATLDETGKHILVACLDRGVIASYETASERPHDHRWRRWSVPEGPTGVATMGDRAYVFSQFARTVSILAIDQRAVFNDFDEPDRPVATIALHAPASPLDEAIAEGRSLFYLRNEAVSADGRVCASCHPDGRDDALTWSTPEGPRQTPMLVDRLDGTAPYGWDGANATLASHVERTTRRLFGHGLSLHQRDAVFAFIESLRAPAPPPPADAKRGREVFVENGCAACHRGELMTDGHGHDVKSRAPGDRAPKFDTPSLLHAGHTAPYFHDGRFATLRELLDATGGTMGDAHEDLSAPDEAALVAYLETL